MKIEQIYTGCLSHGAYYITSDGDAAIIDPLRDVQPYIERFKHDGVKLKYIFETHFHADFVSGHLELSRQTGAPVIYGPGANGGFDLISAEDGQEFPLGKVRVKVLHTPGHTMESATYLLIDEDGKQRAVFSGDTLFLGDVGRPDLAQQASGLTSRELAGLLYDSIKHKIMPLSDDVIVYPGHGAGSACGKHMMKERHDTLGHQKRVNYALLQPDRESFVNAVLDGLHSPPAYFGMNVAMNKNGYRNYDDVLAKALVACTPGELEQSVLVHDAVILDTRSQEDFCNAFIPGSINIGLDGDFAPWTGAVLRDVDQVVFLVTDPGREEEAVSRLARIGFDNVMGYLAGGFDTWIQSGRDTDRIQRINASQLMTEIVLRQPRIIDVRKPSEFESGHLEGAVNKPLEYINDWTNEIPVAGRIYLYCEAGYRSLIAASVLQARGYRNVYDIRGGYRSIVGTSKGILS